MKRLKILIALLFLGVVGFSQYEETKEEIRQLIPDQKKGQVSPNDVYSSFDKTLDKVSDELIDLQLLKTTFDATLEFNRSVGRITGYSPSTGAIGIDAVDTHYYISVPISNTGYFRSNLKDRTSFSGQTYLLLDENGLAFSNVYNVSNNYYTYVGADYFNLDFKKIVEEKPDAAYILISFYSESDNFLEIYNSNQIRHNDWVAGNKYNDNFIPYATMNYYSLLTDIMSDIIIFNASENDQFYFNQFYDNGDYIVFTIAQVGYDGGVGENVCSYSVLKSGIDFNEDKITTINLEPRNNSDIAAILYLNFFEIDELLETHDYGSYYNNSGISTKCLQIYHGEIEVILPSTCYVSPGVEMNFYYDNIIRYGKRENFTYISNTNMNYVFDGWGRRNGYNSSSEYYSLFSFYDQDCVYPIFSDGLTFKNVPKGETPQTKKILLIGDSMTQAGVYQSEISTLLDSDSLDVEWIGTQGTSPLVNEGRNGWRTYTYTKCSDGTEDGVSGVNPFWDGTSFNFSYYMQSNGYSSVDCVCINLGTNDVNDGYNSDSEILSYWQEMINSIHDYDSSIKIILWLCPPVASVRNTLPQKNEKLRVVKLLINNFDNMENDNIFLSPVYLNVDAINDFNWVESSISNRNPSVTIKTVSDITHPSSYGYAKIADVLFSTIKHISTL